MEGITVLGWERLWVHSRLLMLTASFDGKIIAANPAWEELLGWRVDRIVGTSFFDLVHPEDRERTVAEAGAMMRDGRHVPKFENRYRTAAGEYRHLDWTAVSDGEFIHAIGRDKTVQNEQADAILVAEEAMRQAQKMEAIGQLTGGVAHDFNNLLTVIVGSVDLLRRPSISDERRNRYVNAIGDAANRAATLTGQLLAFARKQALKPELLDISASIEAVAGIIRTLIGSRIELELSFSEERLIALADRSQLDTAIINMAINARDAMNGEGRLTIAVEPVSRIPARRAHPAQDGDFIAIIVKDTGAGIAEDAVARVFEPFFTTKQVGEGTGLGLSQVFGFAKQSKGDVRVNSRLGEGAQFTLYLPRISGETELPAGEVVAAAADGSGVCVLVVEDNAGVGSFAADALRELGYNSVLVSTAQQALAELSKDSSRFHVVFSDVVMPGMSGVELAQIIRRDYSELCVILTSGYSHILAENPGHGFELLPKPYSVAQLSHVLRKSVRSSSDQSATPAQGPL